jgi:hypothetical protein
MAWSGVDFLINGVFQRRWTVFLVAGNKAIQVPDFPQHRNARVKTDFSRRNRSFHLRIRHPL